MCGSAAATASAFYPRMPDTTLEAKVVRQFEEQRTAVVLERPASPEQTWAGRIAKPPFEAMAEGRIDVLEIGIAPCVKGRARMNALWEKYYSSVLVFSRRSGRLLAQEWLCHF